MTQIAVSSFVSLDLNFELTQGFAARYIRRKARRLIGHTSLRLHDRDDIEQELSAAVWQAAPLFDPSVGEWASVVATVVERSAAQLLARRRREKRRPENTTDSLDVQVRDADGFEVPLASQIGRDHQAAITGNDALEEHERTELRLDLETLLAQLPEEDRALFLELANHSQIEVARRRGLARRTIRDLLERARGRLANSKELSENEKK